VSSALRELDLSVAIVNWNVRDLLLDCLSSVRHAIEVARLRAEIWVVDNDSQDGSLEAVHARFGASPDLHLLPSMSNLGFGGGQNLALRAMGFEGVALSPIADQALVASLSHGTRTCPRHVLVLNPDTVVRPDALVHLVSWMDERPRVGVCGPRLVYGDGRFQHAAYRFPTLAMCFLDFWPLNWRLTESRLNGRYARALYESGKPFAIDHPLGAAMLLRREVIEQTGGFDLDYRMYVEEIDWCMRIKRAGWAIHCVPQAEVVHYEGQSTRQVRPQMIVSLWRSRYILFEKHYSPLFRWLARRVIRAGMRSRIRRTQGSLAGGHLDPVAARALIDAYWQVGQF
jgi:GT2 family glycosyltransferase